MYAKVLFTTALLLGASTAQTSASVPTSLTKILNDYSALESTGSAFLNAENSWESTQTALPTSVIDSEANADLTGALSATTIHPAFITALPSSLQPQATSFFDDASVLRSDYAVASPASTGSPSHSANSTAGAPTTPAKPSVSTSPENAAGRNGIMIIGGALAVGLTGVIALL